ncbi:WD repeat-containing protein 63 [Borealophlyctis nickersoniae]|nr:WD repeat-containing protein 63 [Borealophlyctis nickersoniae]
MSDTEPAPAQPPTPPATQPPSTPGPRGKSRDNATSRVPSRAVSKMSLAPPETGKSSLSLHPPVSEAGPSTTSDPADGPPAENTGPPPGTMPLFLTTATQELFKVKGGEDLTAENPFKMIPKADLIADLNARLAIGDFYPAKQMILDFPQEEMLLHWDQEFKYGQNYYLCVTVEAMEAILHPVIKEESEEALALLSGIKKAPVSKQWESLGSDKEIDSEKVVHNRDLIHVRVSRKRRDFGSLCKFGDRDAHDGFVECRPFRDPTYELSRMEVTAAVQAVPELVDSTAQTAWFRPVNFAVQYEPAFFSEEEQARELGSDSILDFVRTVSARFEKALRQNSIMDIFEDDYQNLGEEDMTLEQGAHTYLQEYQSFTDLRHSKDKSISCVDWHPTQRGIIAISCTQRAAFDERVEMGFNVRSKQSMILIWSFHDPIHPQLMLEAPEDVGSFQFNPYDSNIVAGGCYSGQIVLWDITEYQDKLKTNRKSARAGTAAGGGMGGEEAAGNAAAPAAAAGGGGSAGGGKDNGERHTDIPIVHWLAVSSIEASHRAPITDIQWLPKNLELAHTGEFVENGDNGHRQLVTTSLDGQVCFWDLRSKKELKALDLTWKPFLREPVALHATVTIKKVPLSSMDNTFDYGLTKISIRNAKPDPSSSEQTSAARPGSPEKARPTSSEKPRTATADKDKAGGAGFSSKFYCATEEGDLVYSNWLAEKANEEKASRVEHAYSYHFGPMSDLQRSPFFPDILLSVGVQNISSIAVSYMAIHQYPAKSFTHHQFIAAGDDEGTLHILEVPRNLTKPSKNEKSFVRAFFDREIRRIAYVQQRKQFRVAERSKFEAAALEALVAKTAKKEGEAAPAGTSPPGTAPAAAAPGTPAAAGGGGDGAGGGAKGEDDEEKAEQEYLKMEHNFLEMEGLLPVPQEA